MPGALSWTLLRAAALLRDVRLPAALGHKGSEFRGGERPTDEVALGQGATVLAQRVPGFLLFDAFSDDVEAQAPPEADR